ncbi:MAG: CRTAC1 family protein, partial [Planctomycetaceae bacterium]
YLVTAGGTPPHLDSAPNAMFRNLAGRFQVVSDRCGAQDRGFGQGVAVGDVNEDGFDDLLVLNYGPNSLWINNGDGTFSDHSQRWLPAHSVWSTSAAIADLDGDNLSDVFIANYCAGLEPTFEECKAANSQLARTCSPNHFAAEPDTILKGTPRGGFVDVTNDWHATPELLGRGLGIVAGSFDSQPGIDLLVANDMTSNHYWTQRQRNSPQDAFALSESGAVRGLAHDGLSRWQGSMGIAVADLNRDNVADFYVTNYENEHNTLYLSRGDAGWNDETGREKLLQETLPMVGFGTQAIDFDHNGEAELIVTNGHVDHLADPNGKVFYQQPAQLFQRNPSGVFESVASQLADRYFRNLHVGRGLWSTDVNRDGKIDVVITHQTEPTALLMNRTDSDHSYISIRLVATSAARTAVGSVASIRSANGEATYPLNSGDGFLCSNERCLYTGLGQDVNDVDVTVRWLDGKVETWSALATGREWLLVQGETAFELVTVLF